MGRLAVDLQLLLGAIDRGDKLGVADEAEVGVGAELPPMDLPRELTDNRLKRWKPNFGFGGKDLRGSRMVARRRAVWRQIQGGR